MSARHQVATAPAICVTKKPVSICIIRSKSLSVASKAVVIIYFYCLMIPS